jgi:hypothetical protein
VNEHTTCPSCDSSNLELRTDCHMMCAACGYIFPEPVDDAIGPLDETPVSGLPRLNDWGDEDGAEQEVNDEDKHE